MQVALIDYGSGNIASAAKALARAGENRHDVVITADPDKVRAADRIVLPGVGAFAGCMAGLTNVKGLFEALQESVIENGTPFLGICVGMQLMARAGHEFGSHKGLGWIEGNVFPIAPNDPKLKIPHMGWNEVTSVQNHPILAGLSPPVHAYFVHSFELRPERRGQLLATTEYGGKLTAMVGRDNMVGTQFHPEKSQAVGLKILGNFLSWSP